MVKNSTRKRRETKAKTMTIPQLRKAFEEINVETSKILSKHPINDESISSFQKSWKKIFGKVIDVSTAESYLRLQGKAKKRGKTYKKQKGGAAPLDYMVGPGIDGSQGTIQGVHGSFLPYVSSGLSFYNNINNIAMDSDCGKVDITPHIAFDMGSNKAGGGDGRPIASTVPTSLSQDIQSMILGKQLPASPDPLQTTYKGF